MNPRRVNKPLPADTSVVDTEVEVLKSRQLAERVVKTLKLDADPEFNRRLLKPTGLGAVVGSAINAQPVVAYQAPVYQQPVYAAPVYAGPPPGYCYDGYRQAYVPCAPAPQVRYGYPQPGY